MAVFAILAAKSLPVAGSDAGEPNTIILSGGRLITGSGDQVIEKSLVIIKGDQISYAGPYDKKELPTPSPSNHIDVDCSGKTLIPGLFDAHIHLGGASVFGYILIQDSRKLNGCLLSGVTSVFDLGGVGSMLFKLRKDEKQGKVQSPRFFAVGPLFTSPKGHGTEYGVPMALTPTTEAEARTAVRELIPQKPDMIKIIYDKGSQRFTSLSYELMEIIIDESHKHGFRVVTHITTLEQAHDAIRAGSDGLAHIMVDAEIDEDLLQAMRRQKVFCIPTLSVFAALGGDVAEDDFIKSSLVAQGVPQEVLKDLNSKGLAFLRNPELWKKYNNFARVNLKKMSKAGIKLVLGTDAGNPYVFFGPSVHYEMELMVRSGLKPLDVITAATKNAAEVLGQNQQLGTIEAGKKADIVIFNENPLEDITNSRNIFKVIKNGEIFDTAALADKVNPSPSPAPASHKSTQPDPAPSPKNAPAKVKGIEAAKAKLQQGLNTWSLDILKESRDMFLQLLMQDDKNSYLCYYVALSDYRIATHYLTTGAMQGAKNYIKESQKYLEKAISAAPDWGELYALYATMLGFEIALDPNSAMTLGMKSFQNFGEAIAKTPDDPRVNLLKGQGDLFTPEAYGGGAEKAITSLTKAISLFEQEKVSDPMLPSWGHEEAHTYLGMAYLQKKEIEKAREHFQKALEINPDFGLAADELAKLDKK